MKTKKQERIAITLRLPKDLMDQLKNLGNGSGSFNDLVVKALEREVRVRYAREVGRSIDEFRERIYREHGPLSDSTPVIREFREGIGHLD